VTEIPEHLLKRSKQRRAAIGGEDAADSAEPAAAAASEATPATAAPAVPAAAAVVAPPVPAPKPVRPEVAAARRRKKIPFWAMPVLVALPLWAYVYQATLEPPPAGEADPLVLGGEVYGGCASCHGATGGGGAGPALTGVLDTWPDYRDHMMWVKLGDAGWPADTYGAADKPKGVGMPDHKAMTDVELAQVTLYERVTFGGLDPTSDEYLALVDIAEGNSTFADGGLGPESEADGVDPSELEAG
jgi:mono/diheme cytochrome c family protein